MQLEAPGMKEIFIELATQNALQDISTSCGIEYLGLGGGGLCANGFRNIRQRH